ncbi:hypothetical protein DYBT9275_01314 [Dyadobacter sp. CECT 9275]|uniref:HPt domain-containing protein n=1 Tax=Dyadobacter helix TaxID=2822344 RepID=A0A916J944_9BACT|nr:hypothetical protein [Dyadobacter sp. CECT 9275]CAG4994091.1 hypothetical protein DYBT9275_01314 [Dyadobacter sp. CECT 9275]
MQYLLELYEKDEEGIKEVLTKVHAQFEILPSRLRAYLNSNDLPHLKLFCHQMTNSALLVGAKKLLSQLSELEEGISDQTLSAREIEGRIKLIETLLPSEIESISIYLQFYS